MNRWNDNLNMELPRKVVPISKPPIIWADVIIRFIVWAGAVAFCAFVWYCISLAAFDLYHLIGGK